MTALAAAAPPTLTPGMRLGRYDLVRRLALGGMAEIFLARASGVGDFNKMMVLKRILPQLAADEDFRRMFLDEARLAATLHHPNVAQVFDVGRDGGQYFFAMEYVAGRDLGQVARQCRERGEEVPLDIAVAVVMGVAAGLHHAHEQRDESGVPLGIVHRDVSPSNVIVGFDGAVKLVDFGIAKAATQRTVTRDGLLKGKVAYMSPEQCMGRPVDRRSDVFALGILLYELTTGTQLFTGESDYAILHQIADVDVPRPSARRPGYPAPLEAICLRALARNPDGRYRTAEELQIDLENFAREAQLVTSSIEVARFMRELCPESERDTTEAPPAGGEEAPLRWRADGLLKPFHAGAATPPPVTTAAAPVSRRFAVGAVGASVFGCVGLFLWWRNRPGPAAAQEVTRANIRQPGRSPWRPPEAPPPLPMAAQTGSAPPAEARVAQATAPPGAESETQSEKESEKIDRQRSRAVKRKPVVRPKPVARSTSAAARRADRDASQAPAQAPRTPAAAGKSASPKGPVDLDAPFPPF